MSTARRTLWWVVLVAAAIAAGAWWWTQRSPVHPPADLPAVAAAPAAPTADAAPAEPVIQHPIEPPAAEPPLAAAGVGAALTDLLGRQAVASFLVLDDFPRRLVATVDNLGRAHAAPLLWPVNPTPGRFTVQEVQEASGGTVIAADNSLRYTPLVLLAESVDASRAVAVYVRLYPLLQRAYEELGYPKRYFNDRLIEVIDQLLATPERAGPLKVQLTQVKGPIAPVRPWVRYEFVDPSLEDLSAGQKMLLRVGPDHQRRLKARLNALRQALLQREKPR